MRKRDYPVIRERRAALRLAEDTREALKGLPVILAGWIAEEGTAALAEQREEELKSRFHPDLAAAAKKRLSVPLPSLEVPVCIWPLSEGGVLSGLWKLTEELDCGIRVDLTRIPVRQESIEICEYFGINPYAMRSGGAFLMVTPQERPVLDALCAAGEKAAVIGTLTAENDCLLVNRGRTSFLSRPAGDSLTELLL